MERLTNKKRVAYRTASFIAGAAGLYGFLLSMNSVRPFPVERQEAYVPSESSKGYHEEWPIALAGVALVVSGTAIGIKLDRIADE